MTSPQLHTKDVARRLGLMPQTSIAPDGITVADLVSRGRFPHQRVFRQWSTDDEKAVADSPGRGRGHRAGGPASRRTVGGQRQRVWVAMLLAQQTSLILLDEPTTFLDIAHQIELLELFTMLSREAGRTVVAVLHDLNHACRFADQIVAMKVGPDRRERHSWRSDYAGADRVGVRPGMSDHRGPGDRYPIGHPARLPRKNDRQA